MKYFCVVKYFRSFSTSDIVNDYDYTHDRAHAHAQAHVHAHAHAYAHAHAHSHAHAHARAHAHDNVMKLLKLIKNLSFCSFESIFS